MNEMPTTAPPKASDWQFLAASLGHEDGLMPSSSPESFAAGHSNGLMPGSPAGASRRLSQPDCSMRTFDFHLATAANTVLDRLNFHTNASINVNAASDSSSGRSRGNSITGAPRETATSLPLPRWMELALQSVGETNGKRPAHSPAYLAAALKIAECLAVQVATLDLEASIDWADNVWVYLQEGPGAGNDDASPAQAAASNLPEAPQDDFDERLGLGLFGSWDSSLDQSGNDNGSPAQAAASNLPEAPQDDFDERLGLGLFDYWDSSLDQSATVAARPADTAVDDTGDSNTHLESFMESFLNAAARRQSASVTESNHYDNDTSSRHSQMKPSANAFAYNNSYDFNPAKSSDNTLDSASASHHQVNYLEIESALICPKNKHVNKPSSQPRTSRQIFHLSLVFYRLFSGGDTPPSTLMTLASLPRAFVSLCTMTLVKNGTASNGNNSSSYNHSNNNGYANMNNDNQDDRSLSNQSNSKRHQGPARKEIGLCQISCEYLLLSGVPSPLCHLIFNMMDCVHGDFAENDCYSNFNDIISDLRLMMDKPDKFLWGFQTMIMDQSSTSSSGTQFQLLSGMDISRHKEFESIGSSYRSCLSGYSQVVIIQGESGSGKSWVAHQVGTFIISGGGIFLTGKFDQVNQATPFSALASVFGQYCDIILNSKELSWAKIITNQLKVALGQDACHLISVIPKLGLILENDIYSTASVFTDLNCSNAVQRLHRLFCLLLEVMAANSVSITFCMDDMQWADEASISVLTRLVTQRCKKFFLLGCCRENEMKNDHPFWDLLQSVQIYGVKVTTIQLHGVGEVELNQVISELLYLSPRLVRPLSDIVHSKTHGNILFISQIMMSLHRDGLLYLDYDQQRWMWDKDKILSMKLPDNVALCFANGIRKLPLDVQAALHTLSMFGLSLKFEYMQLLESQIGLSLLDPLERAASEGLVIKQKGSYEFSHDSIQEASYNMVRDLHRRNNHLIYGKCLLQESSRGNNNNILFLAVNQINLAGPSSVSGGDEYLAMAGYNLIVGKKSMEMSAFHAACSFFEHGIAFLSGRHYWRDHYTLSLELFELASKSALAAGNTQSVQIHIDELIKNARCLDDTLNAHYIHLSYLSHSPGLIEAVEKGISIVLKLGEDIPSNPSNEVLNRHIRQTQSMIKGVSEDDLMNKPMMTDPKKLMAIKFLAEIQGIAFLVLPSVHKIVIMKMVQMTIAYGLSPAAPFGIACFGSFLAKNGNLAAGHRFVLLAKSLLDKIDVKELAGKVLCVVAETCCYMEPLLAANERRVEAEIAAISGGDAYWASTCRLQYVSDLLWGGTHLSKLQSKMTEAQAFVKQYENMTTLAFMFLGQRSIDMLLGIKAELLTIDELSASVGQPTNARHKMIL